MGARGTLFGILSRQELIKLNINNSAKQISKQFKCHIDVIYRLFRSYDINMISHSNDKIIKIANKKAINNIEDAVYYRFVQRNKHVVSNIHNVTTGRKSKCPQFIDNVRVIPRRYYAPKNIYQKQCNRTAERIQHYKQRQQFLKNNPDKIIVKKTQQQKKEEKNSRIRIWQNKKCQTDPIFHHKKCIKTMMYQSFTCRSHSKSKRTQKLLGCSLKWFLQVYIPKLLKEGMTMQNYGDIWTYDHKVPLNCAQTKQQIQKLNHTNLQPMFKSDNIIKGETLLPENYELFVQLLKRSYNTYTPTRKKYEKSSETCNL